MITLDLCQSHYQVLLIIYLKDFIIICVQIVNLSLITYQLKIINSYINVQNEHKEHFNKNLIKTFENTYEFCNRDINEFILLLRRGVYPYQYMDS